VSRLSIVAGALERGERDARLLDGRDFDANYWRNARRQLTTIGRDLDIEKRLNAAFCAVFEQAAEPSEDSATRKGAGS